MPAARRGDSEPRDGSPAAATSRAEPAVSPATTALRPRRRISLRHWPSAWMWLCTVRRSSTRAPGTPISWKCTGRKNSPTMWSSDRGSSAWMSATRPAMELSMGIMARAARPSATAAKASSKVGQARASQSGYTAWQDWCEKAPGSPW